VFRHKCPTGPSTPPPAAPAPSTGEVRRNRFPAWCSVCHQRVEEGAGILSGRRGAWVVTCDPCPPASDLPAVTEPDVPAGHYAIPSATGTNDLDFYRVDRPTEGRWEGYVFVRRVIGGRSDQRIRRSEATAVLQRIADTGAERSMRWYGQEIGRCGRCNRHLTDEDSRAYGLGPTCRTL